MIDLIKLQKKIVPELLELLQKRYNILRAIKYNQPIGRRVLSNKLSLGERTIRNEVDFLKLRELIEICSEGMYITEDGEKIIDNLQDFIHEVKGLKETEENIKKYLNIKDVYIVPGNYEIDDNILQEIGKTGANYLKQILKDNMIISLTGGKSVKELVYNMPKTSKYKKLLVVPARGGMGRYVEIQANTLSANLAEKLGGSYKLLHVPDNLSENALNTMLKEKGIKEVVDCITGSDILIYGIGRADDMAVQRELHKDIINDILNKGAVGEALGNYYDIEGNVIFTNTTIGVKEKDTENMKELIAIAAGESKAEAIIGGLKNKKQAVLITDEGAAEKIINIILKKENNNK